MAQSKAAQMREKRKEGMDIGDIARLFGVSYHYAYQVVVVRAGARDRSAPEVIVPSPAAIRSYTWPKLFEIIDSTQEGKAAATARRAATQEADARDPDGSWVTAAGRKRLLKSKVATHA